jgi:hypothetical protein
MELTQTEWTKVQELLVKLVQALTPITESIAPKSIPDSFLVNEHFFIPKTFLEPVDRFQRPLSIIKTLHSGQKEVDEMITEVVAAAPVPEEKPKKSSLPSFEMKKETLNPKGSLPIQAQKLIEEVQETIGKLCNATQMKEPKKLPLEKALKRLKPTLDRIIEMVISEEKSKNVEIPFSKKPAVHKEEVCVEEQKGSIPLEKEKGILLKEKQVFKQQEINTNPVIRPAERTSIPTAPFIPILKNLSSSTKKKKRKGFWFKEDEKEDKKH